MYNYAAPDALSYHEKAKPRAAPDEDADPRTSCACAWARGLPGAGRERDHLDIQLELGIAVRHPVGAATDIPGFRDSRCW